MPTIKMLYYGVRVGEKDTRVNRWLRIDGNVKNNGTPLMSQLPPDVKDRMVDFNLQGKNQVKRGSTNIAPSAKPGEVWSFDVVKGEIQAFGARYEYFWKHNPDTAQWREMTMEVERQFAAKKEKKKPERVNLSDLTSIRRVYHASDRKNRVVLLAQVIDYIINE